MSETEAQLLVAARAGDEEAFVRLTSPHRAGLHRHCYRLLGSVHDADDAMQETMLRAWRGVDRFEPRAPVGAWLYRIATNVSLRMIERRPRLADENVDAHLEPYPEHLGPEAIVETREAVGLAFVAAMQLLPPKQRATLVLRDVLGWPARDVASFFGESVAAVNSALQRARERLARERDEGSLARLHAPASPRVEAEVMQRFQDAWEAVDVEALVGLLAGDALMTMPPERARVEGAVAIGAFFGTVPLGGRLDRIRLVAVRANGQPAFAAYADGAAYGLMIFALGGDRIIGITGFPERDGLFERHGFVSSL